MVAAIGLAIGIAIAALVILSPTDEEGSVSGYGPTTTVHTHGSVGPSPAVWWVLGRASAPRPVVVHSPAPASRYTPPAYSPPRPSYTPPRSFSNGTPKPSFGSSSGTRSFSSSSRPSFGGRR